MGPLPDTITALLLQSHHLCSISAFPETGRKGIRPDLPSPVGGLVGGGVGPDPGPGTAGVLVTCIFLKLGVNCM